MMRRLGLGWGAVPRCPELLRLLLPLLLLQLLLLSASSVAVVVEQGPVAAASANASSRPSWEPPPAAGNDSAAGRSPVVSVALLLGDLPALKAAVIGACAASAGLIGCLLLRVLRSGRKIKKTRKYDIITTPAERVEMAPLNEEEDEEEDSTVFDIKYR